MLHRRAPFRFNKQDHSSLWFQPFSHTCTTTTSPKELLSPLGITKIKPELLQRVAAESPSAAAPRELLSRKLEVLITGK